MMGRIEEQYRLPMVPVSAGTRTFLERMASELGLLENRQQATGNKKRATGNRQ
jgi:hypothetical protein